MSRTCRFALLGSFSLCVATAALGQMDPEGNPLPPTPTAPAVTQPAETRLSTEAAPFSSPAVIAYPAAARNAASVSSGDASDKAIEAYVGGHVWFLTKGTPTERAAARDFLIKGVEPGTQSAPVSAPYLGAYASHLNKQLTAAMNAKPSPGIRVMIGVTTARVAERIGQSGGSPFQFDALTQQLLKDESPAVVLWGMRSARWVLFAVLDLNKGNPSAAGKLPLLNLIVPTALKHPKLTIIQEAYEALSLPPLNLPQNPGAGPANAGTLGIVIPQVHELLRQRIIRWSKGEPMTSVSADSAGTSFLVLRAVWSQQTPAQQQKSVLLMTEMLKQVSAFGPSVKEQTEARDLISRIASGLGVAAPALAPVTKPLTQLSNPPSWPTVGPLVATLEQAVKALPMMQGAAAMDLGGASSTQPATRAGDAAAAR